MKKKLNKQIALYRKPIELNQRIAIRLYFADI